MPEESKPVSDQNYTENKANILDKNVPNPLAKNSKVHTHKVFASVGLILIGVILAVAGVWWYVGNQSLTKSVGDEVTTNKISTKSTEKSVDKQSTESKTSTSTTNKKAKPCESETKTATTTSCVINISTGELKIIGFPVSTSPNQEGIYKPNLGGDILVTCSVENSCKFNDLIFTEKTFNNVTFGQQYPEKIILTITEPTKVEITIPLSLETSYHYLYCKSCVDYTDHVFKEWGFTQNIEANSSVITTYYISTKRT